MRTKDVVGMGYSSSSGLRLTCKIKDSVCDRNTVGLIMCKYLYLGEYFGNNVVQVVVLSEYSTPRTGPELIVLPDIPSGHRPKSIRSSPSQAQADDLVYPLDHLRLLYTLATLIVSRENINNVCQSDACLIVHT